MNRPYRVECDLFTWLHNTIRGGTQCKDRYLLIVRSYAVSRTYLALFNDMYRADSASSAMWRRWEWVLASTCIVVVREYSWLTVHNQYSENLFSWFSRNSEYLENLEKLYNEKILCPNFLWILKRPLQNQ